MKNLFLLSLIASFFALSSCETEIKDFENLIEVTPEDCQSWDLPDNHFIVSYPTNKNITITKAIDGEYNLSYVMFDYITDDDLCNEEISIGYCDNCASFENDGLIDLVNQLSTQFENQLPDYKLVSLESEDFWGEERVVAKFTFGSEEPIYDYFEAGDYIGIISLMTPKEGNGVMFIMLGNKNSGIKNYEDFGNKGKLGDIFKTFRFVKE